MMEQVPSELRERLAGRIQFVGASLSFSRLAELYQAADTYLSPYTGEGFNLPALEAAACGLPVICTSGGPTDDFVTPEFTLTIRSQRRIWLGANGVEFVVLSPDPQHLVELMTEVIENTAWRQVAQTSGPAHVAGRFTWDHTVDKLVPMLLGN
jgi:glycosyltransferase involved in cell wall biosynthesis